MKANKRSLIAVIICLLCNSYLYAHFEEVGVGARCIGRAKNFVAVCDDVYSIYYNPAGLSQLSRKELTTSCGKIYWGLKDNSNLINSLCFYAHPLKNIQEESSWGTIGIGWLNFILADLYQEDIIILSYGKRLYKNRFAGGINLKWLVKRFGENSETHIDPLFSNGSVVNNYSIDISSLYKLTETISFGLILIDVNQPDMGLKLEDKTLMGIKLGCAYKKDTFNVGLDTYYKDDNLKFYTGGEKWLFQKILGIRGGFGIGDHLYRDLTCGLSWNYPLFQIDYAFAYPLSGIEKTYGTHQISLTLKFGKEIIFKSSLTEEEQVVITAYLREGIDLYQREKLAEARDIFKKIFRIDPRSKVANQHIDSINGRIKIEIKTLYKKASSYYKNSLWKEAEKKWQRILVLDPSEKQAQTFIHSMEQKLDNYFRQGINLSQEKKYIQAIKEWEKIAKVYPYYPQIDEKIQQALVNIKKQKISLKKEIIRKYIKEGLNFYHNKDYFSAVRKWKQVLNLDPYQKETSRLFTELGNKLFQEGMLFYKNGNFKEAINQWTQLLKLTPTYVRAKRAIQKTRKEFIEKSDKLHQQGIKEYNAGKYLKAIIFWKKALQITPQHQKIKNICLEAYLAQGIIYYRENKLKEAAKIWEKALIIQPGHKKTTKYLKRAKTKIKRLKELR
ncbi:hypothetical protein KAI68_02900 [bacterium]|nr:hypothetical protein [bacterium]